MNEMIAIDRFLKKLTERILKIDIQKRLPFASIFLTSWEIYVLREIKKNAFSLVIISFSFWCYS